MQGLTRDRTAEEIRSLSRFQVAQRTGFTKILKKYKRWTKDRDFSQVFKEQIVNEPGSLFQLDLSYLLDQYIDVLGALRAVFDASGTSTANGDDYGANSATARISRTLDQGDELDFDSSLTTIPLGTHGNRATYWIHPDCYVEAQVLLLQHMRLYTGGAKSASRSQSAQVTPARRKSSAANTDKLFGTGDDVAHLVLDHAEAFAMKQNASTIGSTEATKGNIVFKAAASVQCVASGEAAVVVRTNDRSRQPASTDIKSARIGLKSLNSLWAGKGDTNGSTSKEPRSESQDSDNDRDVAVVKQWLAEHKEVRPIAGIASKRTRFIGLHNNSAGGVWACLDRDVYMKTSMSEDLSSDDWPAAVQSQALRFPHAILEVRREGTQAASLIQLLDRSHLVSCFLSH